MKYVALIVLLAGCGIRVQSDPVKVEGTVLHKMVIDPAQLADFYQSYCESKAANQTEAQVDKCVTESLAVFWQAIIMSQPQVIDSEIPTE